MSDVFQIIGHDVKNAAVDTGKGIADAVEWLPNAEHVFATAIKDQPVVKAAILGLVKQAAVVIADIGIDAAAKGFDLVSDLKTLSDAEAFFSYFARTFMPAIEQVYADVKADIK